MKINWRVRFNKNNIQFIIRCIIAVLIPILTYFGLEQEDLTTWVALGSVLARALNNPFVIAFTIMNILNLIPDPTTKGLGDSERALTYEKPE
ncbi:phage holin [Lachnospiraceae bacterium OttesenSCG-928-J05]|nr:phage holin [Lachnospiraceae bacterium OttesenSCG-928-J05]